VKIRTRLGVAGCSSSGREIPTASSRSHRGASQGEKGKRTSVSLEVIFPLLEVLLLFIKKPIFQSVRAVCVRVGLAGAFILLNGFVQGVQLAQQGHIQLPKANLSREEFKQTVLKSRLCWQYNAMYLSLLNKRIKLLSTLSTYKIWKYNSFAKVTRLPTGQNHRIIKVGKDL